MAVVVTIAKGYDLGYIWKTQNHTAEPATGGYYIDAAQAGEPPGRWWGPGAHALGFTPGQRVDRKPYDAVYRQTDPRTGARLGRPRGRYPTFAEHLARLTAAEPHATAERLIELEREAAQATRQPAAYYDVTISFSKSISVLHASIRENERRARLADDRQTAGYWAGREQQFQEVLHRANRAALEYLQAWAGITRTGYHGTRVDGREPGRFEPAGLIVTSWLQGTSRDGDPQDHVHNQIARITRTFRDGKWRALDTMSVRAVLGALQAVAAMAVECELSREFGVDWVPRADGRGNEIRGVTQGQMDAYSTRTVQVREKERELARAWERKHGRAPTSRELLYIANAATLQSRKGKEPGSIDWDALAHRWDATLGGELVGIAPAVSNARGPGAQAGEHHAGRAPSGPPAPEAQTRALAKALTMVSAQHPAWTRHDLLKQLALVLPAETRQMSPEEAHELLLGLAEEALSGRSGEVLCLEAPEWPPLPASLRRNLDGRSVYSRPGVARYATAAQLSLEERLVAQAQAQDAPRVPGELAARRLGADLAQLRAVLAGSAHSPREHHAPRGLRLDQAAAAWHAAFGLAAGPPPDRFFVGLAVLSLLSEVAAERPLVCVVDDGQWLDRASAQALGFAARRLAADPVGLVFAARVPGEELAGLPELEVGGLGDEDARALLATALTGSLDARVRDLIIAETRGNPLALLELPRGLPPAELAGGFGLPGTAPLTGRIEDSFARQVSALPAETRRLLLVAAADPSGDRSLVWRAARRLGIGLQAAAPAVQARLVDFGAPVRFRHPLVRSATYRSASPAERQQAHAALAEVTDRTADPDRRAWHRAQAADGPDEEVAAELEGSAGRAQARGGIAAAAAFLERAALLTADPARQAGRALAAAQASLQAGAFGKALELLDAAEAGGPGALAEMQSAQAGLLRGYVAFASGMGSDAPPQLLTAARRLEGLDLRLARQAYLDAWLAAVFAGRLATRATLLEISRAARQLPPPGDPPSKSDLVLDALTLLVTDGPVAAAPALRTAMDAFTAADVTAEERLRWSTFAEAAAISLWDLDTWSALVERHAATVREVGALDQLALVLVGLGTAVTWTGDLATSAALVAESDTVCETTGTHAPPFAALMLACLRGREAEAVSLVEATIAGATAGGQGLTVGYANWVIAIFYNSLGRYEQALTAATQSSQDAAMYVSMWALPELIEAAVRSGKASLAAEPMARLAESTQTGGTDFGLGIEARCRALLSDGDAAERLYREAVDRLSRTRYRPDLARAHLLYGEWLRRHGRRTDARAQLRTAHEMFDSIGMAAFAGRAARELRTTGETVHKRTVRAPSTLTAQEASIARLAGDGHTNPEIGTQLFLSPRTVEWHLRKIYTKLGVGSRRELHSALARLGPDRPPA